MSQEDNRTDTNQEVEHVLIDGILFERRVGIKTSSEPSCTPSWSSTTDSVSIDPDKWEGFEIYMGYRQDVRPPDPFVDSEDIDPNQTVPDTDYLNFSIRDLKRKGAEISFEVYKLYGYEITDPQQQEKKTILDRAGLSPEQHKLLQTVEKTIVNRAPANDPKYELSAADAMPNVFHIRGLATISVHRNAMTMKAPIAQIRFECHRHKPVYMEVDTQGDKFYMPFWEDRYSAVDTDRKSEPIKSQGSAGRSEAIKSRGSAGRG